MNCSLITRVSIYGIYEGDKSHFTKISISVLAGNFVSFKRNWGIFRLVEGGSPISVIPSCRNIINKMTTQNENSSHHP